MTEITKYKIQGVVVIISVSEFGKFYAKVPELEIISHNTKDVNGGFNTIEEVKKHVEEQITSFFKERITTIKDFAEIITAKLTWTGYQDCYLDHTVLKNILNQTVFPLK